MLGFNFDVPFVELVSPGSGAEIEDFVTMRGIHGFESTYLPELERMGLIGDPKPEYREQLLARRSQNPEYQLLSERYR